MFRRLVATSVLLALALGPPSPARARPAAVTVLVGTSVAETAQATMPPSLWARLVASYVNATVVSGPATPTRADCERAHAAYLVSAPFTLQPRLPGSMHVNDRIKALAHIVVVNCISGDTVYDQTIPLESNPITIGNEGDYEPNPEVTWDRSVRETLAKFPVFFPKISRVVRIDSPFAYVDVQTGTGIAVGQVLRAFATKNGGARTAVLLTVTDVTGKLVQTVFNLNDPAGAPAVGDLVEPYKL